MMNFQNCKAAFQQLSCYLTASFLPMMISLFLNPLYALNLSYRDYGILGFFSSFNLLLISFLGFYFFHYYSFRYFSLETVQERTLLRNRLLTVQFTIGSGIFFLLLLLLKIYMVTANLDFPFWPYAFLGFGTTLLSHFQSFYLLELKLQKKASRYFYFSMGMCLLNNFLSILFVVLIPWGAIGKMLGIFLSQGGIALYCFRKMQVRFNWDMDTIKKAFGFCWPLIPGAAAGYFFNDIDKSFLAVLNDVKLYGLYSIAFQVTGILGMFYAALSQTFHADIYQAVAEKQVRKILRVLIFINLLNTAGMLCFLPFSRFFLYFFTGGRYTEATEFLQIMLLKNILMGICFSCSNVIVALGFSKSALLLQIFGACSSLATFKFLIGQYGFEGGAWAQAFSYSGLLVISIIFLCLVLKNFTSSKNGLSAST